MSAMNEIMSTALAGLNGASERLEGSARRVVSDRDADLPAELVTQKMAEMEFRANLKVFDAANKMMKRTLNILA